MSVCALACVTFGSGNSECQGQVTRTGRAHKRVSIQWGILIAACSTGLVSSRRRCRHIVLEYDLLFLHCRISWPGAPHSSDMLVNGMLVNRCKQRITLCIANRTRKVQTWCTAVFIYQSLMFGHGQASAGPTNNCWFKAQRTRLPADSPPSPLRLPDSFPLVGEFYLKAFPPYPSTPHLTMSGSGKERPLPCD